MFLRTVKVVAVLSAIALAGCAGQDQKSTKLDMYSGITYEKFNNRDVLAGYKRTEEAVDFDQDGLVRCILQSLINDETTLSDSANSFVGVYSGNYYDVKKSHSVSGGEIIKYLMEDSVGVIAEAKTRYSTTFGISPITRAVKYSLLIEKSDKHVNFEATNIMQAQLDSGALSNVGFYKVGSWDGANPDMVIEAINADINKVYRCLKN